MEPHSGGRKSALSVPATASAVQLPFSRFVTGVSLVLSGLAHPRLASSAAIAACLSECMDAPRWRCFSLVSFRVATKSRGRQAA